MALVCYDASDSESSEETEEVSNVKDVDIIQKVPALSSSDNASIFNDLPKPAAPVQHTHLEEVQDEFLLKKEVPTEKPNGKKLVRIFAPSLKDIESDEDDADEQNKSKKFKVSKNCGLFSILPPPKQTLITTQTFVPHSVKNKSKSTSKKAEKRKAKPIKDAEDSDDDIPGEEFDLNAWKQVCARRTKPEVPKTYVTEESVNEDEVNAAPEPEKRYSGLDNEAFQKLVGSSKIRRENIRLIDVNEAEVLSGDDLLRAKALTDPEVEAPKTDVEEISVMSKKKHHITYLAQQAKANEQDLKNRWAANRNLRKQTRAKYGF